MLREYVKTMTCSERGGLFAPLKCLSNLKIIPTTQKKYIMSLYFILKTVRFFYSRALISINSIVLIKKVKVTNYINWVFVSYHIKNIFL